jgi:hypothetical protein
MVPATRPATRPGGRAFSDVRTPWDTWSRCGCRGPGAPVGFCCPPANQISDLLRGLENAPFADVEVLEILVRRYKPVADRLRPEDRMVAHTAFWSSPANPGRPSVSSGDPGRHTAPRNPKPFPRPGNRGRPPRAGRVPQALHRTVRPGPAPEQTGKAAGSFLVFFAFSRRGGYLTTFLS